MKPKRLLIEGGLILDPSQGPESVRDILIEGGRVVPIPSPRELVRLKPSLQVIDARGCWVMPGIIDMHVHLREPGEGSDETIASGTKAAAYGGITTVLAMPNTRPVIDTPRLVRWIRSKARCDAEVSVLVAGAVTSGQKGLKLTAMERMAEAGAAAFSDDGLPVMNTQLMKRALEFSRVLALPVLDHAEDLHLTGRGVAHEGRLTRLKGLPGIPSASESLMAMRDIHLAELTGGSLHLCHVSAKETVDLLRQAKKRGIAVTAEATPHHFTLTDTDIPDLDPNFKMKPPLRSRKDRDAILEGLADGTIDAIATDHAPHSPRKKSAGYLRSPFGVIGLETLLGLSLALVQRGVLSRRQLAERLCRAPARILGLKTKGHLRPGADGDVTVVDPAVSYTVGHRFASKSRNSPFIGRRLKGRARATIVGGEVVYSS